MIKTTYRDQHKPAIAGFFVFAMTPKPLVDLISRHNRATRLSLQHSSSMECHRLRSMIMATAVYDEWLDSARKIGGVM